AHMLVVRNSAKGKVRSLYALPVETIKRDIQIAQSGAGREDAALPPLSDVDWNLEKDVTLFALPTGNVAWDEKLLADPSPAPRDTLAPRPVPMKAKAGEIQRVVFPDPGAAQAFVVCGGRPRWIDRHDLTGGKYLGRIEI